MIFYIILAIWVVLILLISKSTKPIELLTNLVS
jgi:hypothetical protein